MTKSNWPWSQQMQLFVYQLGFDLQTWHLLYLLPPVSPQQYHIAFLPLIQYFPAHNEAWMLRSIHVEHELISIMLYVLSITRQLLPKTTYVHKCMYQIQLSYTNLVGLLWAERLQLYVVLPLTLTLGYQFITRLSSSNKLLVHQKLW